MTRSNDAITADLDKIHGTLDGLSTGLTLATPAIAATLGSRAAVDQAIGPVLDTLQAIARVLTDLQERQLELKANQDKIVNGIGEAARVLT